jgi:hypothetical protein
LPAISRVHQAVAESSRHTFIVSNAGALAPASLATGELAAVDPDLLLEAFLLLRYRVA